jgi:predicted TPR repeat methyltransferase
MISTPTPPDAIARRLQTVHHLITSGKLSEAAERLNGVAKSAPTDARVYLIGMRLGDAANNPAAAQKAARKAVELAPDWPLAVTEMALLLARQNQFQEAITFARRAVELDGDNVTVLGHVIDVAHRALHLDLAVEWLERAVRLAPGQLHLRHLLARDLRQQGNHARAIAGYDALLAAQPNDAEALAGRLQSRVQLGEMELAAQDGLKLVALLPGSEEAVYWNEIAHGRTPEKQPLSMVRQMYDGFAEVFDQHLVAGLKYKLPREVAALITERYPERKLNLLDLGCGTGLLGACLGRIQGALIGVEISSKMIEQAARHGVYDRFHNIDLFDALRETPESLYDVIAALDVFIYVGNLTGAIPNAHRILVPGGSFIFSCEAANEDEPDLVLRRSQRYAHKASHIEAACRAAGFEEVSLKPLDLRYEGMEPVQGFLVVARKASAA